MSTLREALEAKVKFWRGCYERPLVYRCKACPDGDYEWSERKPLVPVTVAPVPKKEYCHVCGGAGKRGSGKDCKQCRGTGEKMKFGLVEDPIDWVMQCPKCGHVNENPPMSIGPLYDMGSLSELKGIVEELEKLLQENPDPKFWECRLGKENVMGSVDTIDLGKYAETVKEQEKKPMDPGAGQPQNDTEDKTTVVPKEG